MTTTTTGSATETLHGALEEHYLTFTERLTHLSVFRDRPDHGGYDADTLDALIEWARRGVAETAHALQRMSDGTYGVCERCAGEIPLSRLTGQPEIRVCGDCGTA